MTRRHVGATVAVLTALTLVPSHGARGQLTQRPQVGVSAGMNVPLGTLSQSASTGYRMNAFLTGTPRGWPVALRGDLSYNSFAERQGRVHQNFAGFSLDAMYPATSAGARETPYLIGGAGVDHASSYIGRPSEDDLALDFGAGYRWRRARASYFVEMRYVYVDHTGPSRQMLPFTFGIAF
jgi:hypothetical protein